MTSSGISLPSAVMMTWLPVMSLVCSQISVFSDSLQVSLSFCLLFLPTRLTKPSYLNLIGGRAFGGLPLVLFCLI